MRKRLIIGVLAFCFSFSLYANNESSKLHYLKEFVDNVKDGQEVSIAKMIKGSIISKEKKIIAKEEVEAIFNEENFVFDRTKKCLFIPEFALLFGGNTENVILVSISCKQMRFISKDRRFILDFDPAAKKIKEIVQ